MSIGHAPTNRALCADCGKQFAKRRTYWTRCRSCQDAATQRRRTLGHDGGGIKLKRTTDECHHCHKLSLDLDTSRICGDCRRLQHHLATSSGPG